MKSCSKKPCFWALALIVLVTGGLFVWAWNAFSGPLCFNLGHPPGGYTDEAQYPMPPLWGAHSNRIVFNDSPRMYAVTIDPLSIVSFRSPEDAFNEYSAFEYASSLSYQGVIALTESEYTTPCQIAFNIEIVNTDGSDRQLLSTRLSTIGRSHYYPVWSRNGERIAYLSAQFSSDPALHTMDKNGEDVRHYPSDIEVQIHPPFWSPNGERIAFIGNKPTPELHPIPPTPFIAIADFNDSSVLKLAPTSSLPGWSPDSGRIAFVRHRNGFSTIYTIEADGANLRAVRSFRDTLPDLSRERYPLGGKHRLPRGHVSWSRDGSEIRLHQSPFVVVNADGSNLRIMQGQPGALASWSPDESQIAVYASDLDVRLFTMNPDGSNKQSLARWDSAAGEFKAERVRLIDGFYWKPHPSSLEVEQ